MTTLQTAGEALDSADKLKAAQAEIERLATVVNLQVENYAELKEQYGALEGYFYTVTTDRDAALARLAAAEARIACNTKVLQDMHDEDIKVIERLKGHIKHIGNDALRTENAELRARLAELEKQDDSNAGVVVGFTQEGLALVDYPCEGNTISLEEGMLLYAGASPVQPSQSGEA